MANFVVFARSRFVKSVKSYRIACSRSSVVLYCIVSYWDYIPFPTHKEGDSFVYA